MVGNNERAVARFLKLGRVIELIGSQHMLLVIAVVIVSVTDMIIIIIIIIIIITMGSPGPPPLRRPSALRATHLFLLNFASTPHGRQARR